MKVASAVALARLLRARLAEGGDPARPLTLRELLEQALPYPLAREALGLAGKSEYDLAVLDLLRRRDLAQVDPSLVEAVERELELPEPGLGFARVFEDRLLRLRDADPPAGEGASRPGAEQASSDADDAASGADEALETDEEGLDLIATDPRPPEAMAGADLGADPAADAEPALDAEPVLDAPPVPDAPPVSDTGAVPDAAPEPMQTANVQIPRHEGGGLACWRCRAGLPDRHVVRFCPACGVSQERRRCPECGDRVDDDWHFCVRCGTELRSE